jgi:hypothetical protein
MSAWWSGLSGLEHLFYLIAFPSSFILFLQLILNLVGLGSHDVDTAMSADMPSGAVMDHPDLAAHSTGLGLLSVRTVVAFFVGFGWAGVVTLGLGLSPVPAVLTAFGVGVMFLLTVFQIMRTILRLSDTGNVDLSNAVGQTGTVYLPIPAKCAGVGQIQVVVQGRLREVQAATDGEDALPVGLPVQVVKMLSGSSALVRRLEVK